MKPASHAYRVADDRARLAYRRQRAEALAGDLARRQHAASLIAPLAAVSIPRDDGYAVVARGGLDVNAVIAAAGVILSATDIEQKKAKANKPFMMKVGNTQAVSRESPLIEFALRPQVIASAAQYLGMVPILQYANVFYSSHTDAEPAKSQLYHCDSDEVEQVKIFILCETVTHESGPLTFLPASVSQRVRDRTGYMYKTRLTDEQVQAAAEAFDAASPAEAGLHVESAFRRTSAAAAEVVLVGPPGTTAFIDTSRCLHYGSRFVDRSARRIVVMFQYVTPLAFILPEDDYRSGARFRHLATSATDELTALVLGAQ